MLTHSEAFWLQLTTLFAVFISPVIAVIITIWYQNREGKRRAKMALFMDLISFRDYLPLTWQYVVALNRIDVIFHKQPEILRLWHEYYDLTLPEQIGTVPAQLKEKSIALISAIAKHLGYRNIDQIFLQRYYQPKGHVQQFVNDFELKQELLRVLKSTETLFVLGKYEETSLEKDFKDGKIDRKKLNEGIN